VASPPRMTLGGFLATSAFFLAGLFLAGCSGGAFFLATDAAAVGFFFSGICSSFSGLTPHIFLGTPRRRLRGIRALWTHVRETMMPMIPDILSSPSIGMGMGMGMGGSTMQQHQQRIETLSLNVSTLSLNVSHLSRRIDMVEQMLTLQQQTNEAMLRASRDAPYNAVNSHQGSSENHVQHMHHQLMMRRLVPDAEEMGMVLGVSATGAEGVGRSMAGDVQVVIVDDASGSASLVEHCGGRRAAA
jgi:hypothetical protein